MPDTHRGEAEAEGPQNEGNPCFRDGGSLSTQLREGPGQNTELLLYEIKPGESLKMKR